MLAKPDPSTFQILPWRSGDGPRTARMFCDIVMPDGSPSYADPRLRAQAHAEHGRRARASPSTPTPRSSSTCSRTPRRRAASRCRSTAAATSTTPRSRMGADFRREAITMLESMGISVEFSHHEGGPGQQEIDLRYADALSTADNIMTFRTVDPRGGAEPGHLGDVHAQAVHRRTPGSGMHTHVSLFEGDRNAFFEAGAEYQLSKTGRQFIAGILRARQRDHRASPTSGSTATSGCSAAARRRRTSAGATTTARRWSGCRCTSRNKGQSTRIELRTIDSACNPYLAFAVVLGGRHEGHRGGLRAAARGRGRRLVADRARAQEPRHRAAAEQPVRRDRASPRTPSCSPRRSASTSSTSSCATSAPSGRSTAPRSPPSSATGCCRSSEPGRYSDDVRRRPTSARGSSTVTAAARGIERLGDAGLPLTDELAAAADPDAALDGLLRLVDALDEQAEGAGRRCSPSSPTTRAPRCGCCACSARARRWPTTSAATPSSGAS